MGIELGLFGKPIEEQLKEQGYKFKKESYKELYTKLIHSWNMLRMHGIATDGETDKIAKRLMKKLEQDVERGDYE